MNQDSSDRARVFNTGSERLRVWKWCSGLMLWDNIQFTSYSCKSSFVSLLKKMHEEFECVYVQKKILQPHKIHRCVEKICSARNILRIYKYIMHENDLSSEVKQKVNMWAWIKRRKRCYNLKPVHRSWGVSVHVGLKSNLSNQTVCSCVALRVRNMLKTRLKLPIALFVWAATLQEK